jgi:hypothetical protein
MGHKGFEGLGGRKEKKKWAAGKKKEKRREGWAAGR